MISDDYENNCDTADSAETTDKLNPWAVAQLLMLANIINLQPKWWNETNWKERIWT